VSTLAEIESAVDALPLPQQKELFQHLAERLNARTEPKRHLPLVPATGVPITQTEIDDALDTERSDVPPKEAEALKVFWQLQGAAGLTAEGAAAWKDAVAEARR